MQLVPPDHPVLWQASSPVADVAMLAPLVEKLTALMKELKGFGLAAPQIGAGVQLFVTRYESMPVVFNPVWRATTDACTSKPERSLNRPDWSGFIRRSDVIYATWLNAAGEECQGDFFGMDARVFQHLSGICDGHPIFPRPITRQLPLGISGG